MKYLVRLAALGVILLLNSCQNNSTANKETNSKLVSKQFIGSWVQLNPINAKEVQGFVLNADGSAQSINMATMIYKKWWIDSNKLVLILESIGNKVTSFDTIKYDVVEINDTELKLKEGTLLDEYRRK